MKILVAMLVVIGAAMISTDAALAASPTPQEMGREVKVPETPEQHATLAKYYDEKAADAKLDAAYHRSMAAQFQKANMEPKDVAAMQKHCDKLAKDADDQAKEAKAMADYYRARAKGP
jgi:hypothetical protein